MLFILLFIVGCGTTNESGKNQNSNNINEGKKGPYEGEKITLTIGNSALGDAILKLLPQFEQESGVKVEVDNLSEDQLSQKLSIQFTGSSDTPDVFMFRANNEGPTFYANGWTEPLDEFVEKDPEFDINDYPDSAKYSVTHNETLMALPGATAQGVMYYRKDLLENEGIPVPKTMDELKDAVQKIHDPDNGIYGFVARGAEKALVSQIGTFLYSEGGDFITDGKATINTAEAIRAFTNYGTLLKDYGPKGYLNFDWVQAAELFSQGKAAFYVDGSPIHTNFATEDKSEYWDKIGYASIPEGEGGSVSYNAVNWSLAMNSNSNKKDIAWYLMSWLMNKENTIKIQQDGAPTARISAWENPEGGKAFPDELVEVIISAQENGKGYQQVPVNHVNEARDAVGKVVTKVLTGGSDKEIKKVADEQNRVIQEIIDSEKEQ